MIVLVKIALIVCALFFLIRLKWDLGLVLFLDTLLMAVLFGMKPADIRAERLPGADRGKRSNSSGSSSSFFISASSSSARGHFRTMVDALKNLVHDPRLILAIPSAFIGLLPMTAGAMMGAPIVDEAGEMGARAGLEDVSTTTGSATSGNTAGPSTST